MNLKRKKKTVVLNVNERDKFYIKVRAEHLGITVSEYLRGLVKKDMKKIHWRENYKIKINE